MAQRENRKKILEEYAQLLYKVGKLTRNLELVTIFLEAEERQYAKNKAEINKRAREFLIKALLGETSTQSPHYKRSLESPMKNRVVPRTRKSAANQIELGFKSEIDKIARLVDDFISLEKSAAVSFRTSEEGVKTINEFTDSLYKAGRLLTTYRPRTEGEGIETARHAINILNRIKKACEVIIDSGT